MTSAPERPRVALALVHHPVLRDRAGTVGSTSVTPLNVHDLARAARTYGVSPFYVVTPLASQQALIGRILRHYLEGYGGEANPTRAEALRDVILTGSINEALDDLCRRAGRLPPGGGDGGAGQPAQRGLPGVRRARGRRGPTLDPALRDWLGAGAGGGGAVRRVPAAAAGAWRVQPPAGALGRGHHT